MFQPMLTLLLSEPANQDSQRMKHDEILGELTLGKYSSKLLPTSRNTLKI